MRPDAYPDECSTGVGPATATRHQGQLEEAFFESLAFMQSLLQRRPV